MSSLGYLEEYDLSKVGDLNRIWDHAVEFGEVITQSLIPSKEKILDFFDPDDLLDTFPESRLASLIYGSSLTEIEYKKVVHRFIEHLERGDLDAEHFPGYALAPIESRGGKTFWLIILRTGFSFSILRTWLGGIYRSKEEALRSVRMEKRIV